MNDLMSRNNAIFAPVDRGTGKLTVAVKDCIDIVGMPSKGGSAALDDTPGAQTDAAVVKGLLAADCRIIGKANMHELAYGVTGLNAWTGSPVNPHFPDYVPGGSSSGCAVSVAEHLVDFAIGTDTGGSIRIPAACCGVYGLKPTFGRVSRLGAWPRMSSLDCIGPFARSMAMIETAMSAIAPDFVPHADRSLRFARVRVEGVDAAVEAAFDAALKPFKATADVTLVGLSDAFQANMAIIAAETYAAFGYLLSGGRIGDDVAARLSAAAHVDAEKLADAEIVRARFTVHVDALLQDCDVLVMPTMPCFPLLLSESGDAAAALRMTALARPFNLSGHPALTIPVLAPEALPIGIQVIGRRGEDETVCAFGRMFEREAAVTRISANEDIDQ